MIQFLFESSIYLDVQAKCDCLQMKLLLLTLLISLSGFYVSGFSFSPPQQLRLQSKKVGFSVRSVHTEIKVDIGAPPTSLQTSQFPSIKNLKNVGRTTSSEDPILQSWNEFKGLSERELLHNSESAEVHYSTNVNRENRALSLAYRRCEYVTKLFSKTFYLGTSLMQPAARQHVWAIYTWCRRTGKLV